MKRVSVFGLGKVGHVLAICLAAAGHQVIGVDPDDKIVKGINTGTLVSFEPGVARRLQKVFGKKLTATLDAEKAVLESDISCIIVPTPSNASGGFSLQYVLKVIRSIGRAIARKKTYHLVLVISTVLPGSSEFVIIPELEQAAGKKLGANLGYCYNPIFIALGEVVKGLIEPDYLLIGESSKRAGDMAITLHAPLIKKTAPIMRQMPIEAEITKIASNTHETMRVSFANMLCALTAQVPGANVDQVTGALAHRMGKRFFVGATPYGGPCWPRDNRALAAFMDSLGLGSMLPKTIDLYNAWYAKFIRQQILDLTKKGTRVSILGLAYKVGTPNIERAFGMDLARWLVIAGRKVVVWDPLAIAAARQVLGHKVRYALSGNGCLEMAELVVIINPLPELNQLDWSKVTGTPVLDLWRCLTTQNTTRLKHYFPWGGKNQKRVWPKQISKTLRELTK
ncbi:hypothetical protein A3A59_02390 [Candidatus Gottesmanbacteria bacterium RIFCSPLOWO2_01_FULL_42_10]|nr:MAG: hypothetical protein A3A59_02390 [Candidatus Gottesmanbacteria bacterium RIFCSPLOWO2_01_FULL_42_10]